MIKNHTQKKSTDFVYLFNVFNFEKCDLLPSCTNVQSCINEVND